MSNELSFEKQVRFEDGVLQAGFTQVPNVVLRDPRLSAPAKVLYALLSSYAWQDDSCFPGQERLAEEMRLSDRRVRDVSKELVSAGLLEMTRRGLGRTNLYVLKTPDRKLTSGLTGSPLPTNKTQKEEDSVSPSISPSSSGLDDERVKELFSYWQEKLGRERSRLTPGRRKKIQARLNDGISLEQLKRAVDGCAGSDFHVQNGHSDLTLICRSEEKVEFFAALAGDPDEDFFAGSEFAS